MRPVLVRSMTIAVGALVTRVRNLARLKTLNDESEKHQHLLDHADQSLLECVEYMSSTWLAMAQETRSGVQANTDTLLSGFAQNALLRERFATGAAQRVTSVNQVWNNKVVLVNLSSLEYGTAAQVILTFMKIALYREARLREIKMGESCRDQRVCLMIDEWQEMVTADSKGISDSTFYNVNRSTGLFAVCATQSRKALDMVIGHEATDNLLTNFRHRICLRVEDPATSAFFVDLAGKTLRSRVFFNDVKASWSALVNEVGGDPLITCEPATIESVCDSSPARFVSTALFNLQGLFDSVETQTEALRSAYDVQINRGFAESDANADAHWEAQLELKSHDEILAQRRDGKEIVDSLAPADLYTMGQARAFCYTMRAGQSQVDIVNLLSE